MVRTFPLFSGTVAAGAAVTTTLAVACKDSAEVFFYLTGTSGGAWGAVAVEQSWDGGASFQALDAALLETGGNAATLTPPATRVVAVSGHSAANPAIGHIPATHLRVKITGNAGASPANDTLGVTVSADVLYDAAAPALA